MQSPHVTIGSFDRQNLFYSCKSFVQGNAFLNELVAEISSCVDKTESTIIYCTTVKNVEEVLTFLQTPALCITVLFCIDKVAGNSS